MAGLWVLPEYNIIDVTSGSATSFASGYPLTNIYDEYKKPWKVWRSTSLVQQTITLNFTATMNAITLFNCNFKQISIGGSTYDLGLESEIVEYRGISFVNFTNHHQPREGTMVKKKLFAELLNGTGIAPGILLR